MFILEVPCRPLELNQQGLVLEMAIQAGAEAIVNLKDELNEWDSKVGDGDCGTTVSFDLVSQWLSKCDNIFSCGSSQMCKGAIAVLEDLKQQ